MADSQEDSQNILIFSSSIILTVIGFIGNSLVLFIFTRKKFRNVVMFRYLIVVGVSDLINLVTMWPYSYPDFFKMSTNSISCKVIVYLTNIIYCATSWFSLLCSLDRFLSVYYPRSFSMRKKLRFQVWVIGIIGIIMIIINVPFYLYFGIVYSSNATDCGYIDDNIDDNIIYIGFFMDLYASLTAVFIPFFLMVLSTALIGWRLIMKKNILQENPRKFQKDKRLVKILFSLDLFFLFCNLPASVLTVVADSYSINYFGTFSYILVNNLTIVYNSLKFAVYFISNRLFREYFISTFCCVRKTRNEPVHTNKFGQSTTNF